MCIGVNTSDGFLTRLGADPDILLIGLITFVITGLIFHQGLAFIVLVILMVIGANVPDETASAMGYNPEYLLVGLIALVLTPFVIDKLGI